MEKQESKGKIVRETFPSEIISIIGDIMAGIVLLLLILSFKSFLVLIIIVPALLSLRGNLSSPFIARTSRDFILRNRQSLLDLRRLLPDAKVLANHRDKGKNDCASNRYII